MALLYLYGRFFFFTSCLQYLFHYLVTNKNSKSDSTFHITFKFRLIITRKTNIQFKSINALKTLDNTSLSLLVHVYCYKCMTQVSSPYTIFRSSDWNSVVAEPIGLRQCLRIAPKKFCPRSGITQQRSGTISKKALLKTHVQLSFAWHVKISTITTKGISERFLLVIYVNVSFLMEIIWLQHVSVGCSD